MEPCEHFVNVNGVCEKTGPRCPAIERALAGCGFAGCDWCTHPEWRTVFATPARPVEEICAWCGKARDYMGAFRCDYCGGVGWLEKDRPCPDCGGAGVY